MGELIVSQRWLAARKVPRSAPTDPNAVVVPRWRLRALLGTCDNDGGDADISSTPERELNYRQMMLCFRNMASGMPATCVTRIDTELIRYGLLFMRGDEELVPSQAMADFVQRNFTVLLQQALRTITAIGVCPLAKERNEETGQVTIYVPTPGSYRLGVLSVRGKLYIKFYWNTSTTLDATAPGQSATTRYEYNPALNEAVRGYYLATNETPGANLGVCDDTVVVMHNFGYDPSVSGELRSVMASILFPYIAMATNFTRQAIVAGNIAANPPVFTAYNDKIDVSQRQKLVEGFFVGHGVADATAPGLASEASTAYQRTDRQIDGLRNNMRQMAERLPPSVMAQFGVDESFYADGSSQVVARDGAAGCDETGNPMPWKNEFQIDRERVLVQHQLPETRADLVPLLTYSDERVCAAMGTPIDIFHSAAGTKASNAEIVNNTLDATVGRWKSILSVVLTAAYDGTFLDADIYSNLTERLRKRKPQATARLTEEDVFGASNDSGRVRVLFRNTPSMSTDELKYMYARHIIGWQVFAENYARRCGIDMAQVETEKDVFDEEARRLCGVPEYAEWLKLETTRELETAKLKATAADAKKKKSE